MFKPEITPLLILHQLRATTAEKADDLLARIRQLYSAMSGAQPEAAIGLSNKSRQSRVTGGVSGRMEANRGVSRLRRQWHSRSPVAAAGRRLAMIARTWPDSSVAR